MGDEATLDSRPEARSSRAGSPCCCALADAGVGLLPAPRAGRRRAGLAWIASHLVARTRRLRRGSKLERPVEQADCRGNVLAAHARCPRQSGEPFAGASSKLVRLLASDARARRGSGAPARGGSRGSRRARSGRAPCPSSQSAKRSCSSARVAFGQRVVGGVADQKVAEAEGVVAGELRPVGPDELLAHERHQLRRHVVLVGRERLDAAAVEDLALDRRRARALRARTGRAGRAGRRGAPGSSAARRRRRSATRRPSRASARRRAGCPRPPRGSERAARRRAASPSSRSISSSVSSALERLEQDGGRVQLAAGPRRRRSSSSGRAMQRSRIGASRLQSATWSTRSRNVGSAQCRSSKTQTTGARLLEQLAERPRDLVGRRRLLPTRRAATRSPRPRVGPTAAGQLDHDLDDRPVRDSLAVREAAAAHDRRRRRATRGTPPSGATCRRPPRRGA